MSMSGETTAFYMTLTPTVEVRTEEEYEQLMSDFETQLRKPIKLDSRMKWRVKAHLHLIRISEFGCKTIVLCLYPNVHKSHPNV